MRRRVVWLRAAQDDYIIAYEVVVLPDGTEAVAILHVIHGARDWPKGKCPKA